MIFCGLLKQLNRHENSMTNNTGIWIFVLIICHIILCSWNISFLYRNRNDTLSDIEIISEVASGHNIFFYILHKEILFALVKGDTNIYSNFGSPIMLGFDFRSINTLDFQEFLESLEAAFFQISFFYNDKPLVNTELTGNSPIGIIIKKNVVFYIIVLYTREDVWWFGSLKSDTNFYKKSQGVNFSNPNSIRLLSQEGLLDKFEGLPIIINGVSKNFICPKNIEKFINDLKDSRFLECNVTRAKLFKNRYNYDTSIFAKRFRHRARKLLSVTKVVLDNLSIPFWLSSGTCLGYLRECDIIPYSQDVDIGVFIQDFNYQIISEMYAHNIYLKYWFGELDDSLELSFIDKKTGLKLDIFFFYTEDDIYWNGGTQMKTGKKFKYIFQKFNLCWTLFLGLKLRIPCDTEAYVIANYGQNWTIPIREWDWKSSPPNVRNNGIWPKSKWSSVMKSWK